MARLSVLVPEGPSEYWQGLVPPGSAGGAFSSKFLRLVDTSEPSIPGSLLILNQGPRLGSQRLSLGLLTLSTWSLQSRSHLSHSFKSLPLASVSWRFFFSSFKGSYDLIRTIQVIQGDPSLISLVPGGGDHAHNPSMDSRGGSRWVKTFESWLYSSQGDNDKAQGLEV